MLKARVNNLILLGLSHANLDQLLSNQPILTDLSDLDLPEIRVLITVRQPDGHIAIPRDADDYIGFFLPAKLIPDLRDQIQVARQEVGPLIFIIFGDETEETIARQLKQLTNVHTRVIHRGQDPSSVSPNEN